MQQATIDQAIQLAHQHQLAGRLAEAEAICRQVLAQQPNHPHALHLLGTIAHRAGRGDMAVELIRRAISIAPSEAGFHLTLATVLQSQRQLDPAIAAFSRAVQLAPAAVETHFGLGVALYERGRVDDAIAAHLNVIRLRPDLPEAHYNLGCLYHSQKNFTEAVASYSRAVALRPDHAPAYNNMGNAFKDCGKLDDAIAAYRRATQVQPGFIDAHVNIAIALREQKKIDEAVAAGRVAVQVNANSPEAYFALGCALADRNKPIEAIAALSRVTELNPRHAEAYNSLGNALSDLRRFEPAIAAFSRAIALKPDFAKGYNNLGNALKEAGRVEEAIAALRRSIELEPELAATHYNLAAALWARGANGEKKTDQKFAEVIASYRKAIELQPDFPDAFYNMGIAFYEQGKLDDAAAAYAEACRLKPSFTLAHLNFGNVRKDQGLLDEALAAYDRAIALEPHRADIHSNRVYVIHFHPAYDPRAIYEANREWNRRHAAPLKQLIQLHRNSRDLDRRLRIGYLSPDFGMHPIGRFMLPLLENHDHTHFEIFCYADVRPPDALTHRLRAGADTWRSIIGMSDDEVADLVREDGIDVLVDLAMHMTHHRLLVFARKPAPVQVTYLAYCSTTGVEAIDYRLTDPYLDPPGQDEFYCERSVRLPQTYWCYDPGMPTPDVGPLPAAANGSITFGCLNNFCKASLDTHRTWCRLLRQVPTSRFILHASEGSHRQRFIDLLKQEGIDPARLRFAGHVPMEKYFDLYNQIDIGLDPFPWPGGTTTCDALWMGVPVVTLAGQTAVSRAGVSLLSNVGLLELIARTQDQYIQIAADLANDVPRLANIRCSLRDRMKHSPVMNAPAFARNVEAAYRDMWRRLTG